MTAMPRCPACWSPPTSPPRCATASTAGGGWWPRPRRPASRRRPFSASLAYYDGLRRERLPAALIQGLRDNFGAHTYYRADADGTFHTEWAGDLKEHPA